MAEKTLFFRLLKHDDDLREAIKNIEEKQLSQLCRDGLRMALGLKTKKVARVIVTEQPLEVPNEPIFRKTGKPFVNKLN